MLLLTAEVHPKLKKLSVEVEFGSTGSKSCCAVIDSVVRKGFSRKILRKPDLVVVANYVIVATALQSAGCYIVGFSHGEAVNHAQCNQGLLQF